MSNPHDPLGKTDRNGNPVKHWSEMHGSVMSQMNRDTIFRSCIQYVADSSEVFRKARNAFGDFLVDFVCAFFQGENAKTDENSALPWRTTIERAMKTPIFRRARGYTSRNIIDAIIWAIACCESLAHQVEEQWRDDNNVNEPNESDSADGESGDGDGSGDGNASADEVEKMLQEMRDSIETKNAMQGAAESAEETIKQIDELNEALGVGGTEAGDGKPELTKGNIEKRARIADLYENNPRLKSLSDVIGRLNAIQDAMGSSTEMREDAATFHGQERGADLSRVQSTELAKDDDIFDADFAEDSLALDEFKSKQPIGRGPIYILQDKSGSTSCPSGSNDGATIDDWMSAIGLSLLRIARRQKRDLVHIPYAGGAQPTYSETRFPKGEATIETAMHCIMLRPAGGTNTSGAIKETMAMIKSDEKRGIKGADILLLHDGCDHIDDAASLRARLDKDGIALYSIVIGAQNSALKTVSDFCIDGLSLAQREGRDDALRAIYKSIDDSVK